MQGKQSTDNRERHVRVTCIWRTELQKEGSLNSIMQQEKFGTSTGRYVKIEKIKLDG